MAGERIFCVHAWRYYEFEGQQHQEYCDPDENPDGWTAYERIETPDDPQQPFDVPWEVDVADREAAMAAASNRAAELGLPTLQTQEY